MTPQELAAKTGEHLGTSEWAEMSQERINMFADATGDHQFIHINEEAAKMTPFGGTIAHGFLTLSMLSAMHSEAVPNLKETNFGINYGFNKIRFMAPVPVNGRIRGRFFLKEARLRGPGRMMTTYEVTIEIDGVKKPAMTAR